MKKGKDWTAKAVAAQRKATLSARARRAVAQANRDNAREIKVTLPQAPWDRLEGGADAGPR